MLIKVGHEHFVIEQRKEHLERQLVQTRHLFHCALFATENHKHNVCFYVGSAIGDWHFFENLGIIFAQRFHIACGECWGLHNSGLSEWSKVECLSGYFEIRE